MPKVPPAPDRPPAGRTVTVPSSSSTRAARRRSGSSGPATGTRRVTTPSKEDFDHAEKDALLQLRIGRSAHLYAVLVSALLALDGILLLFFYPDLPRLLRSESGTPAVAHTFYLLLPLLAGLAVATIGVASKWEAFQLWPWEPHFSTTIAALAVNILLAIVYALRVLAVGPFATLALFPWFFPAELFGVSLALFGFVITWSGWGGRQWAAAVTALLPIGTGFFAYFPPTNTTGLADALAVGLFLAAFFYQTSGSFLHLISSGTRSHERELITSGQSRMFRFADEIRQREEAVHFREAAAVKREAEIESGLASVRRQTESLKEARAQLDGLEEDYLKRSDAVAAREQETAAQAASTDSRVRLLEDKTTALEMREQEVARLLPQVSAREQRLVTREGEQARRDAELEQRRSEVERREGMVAETEARLTARKAEIDQKSQELLRREGDVTAREGPGRPPSGAPSPVPESRATEEARLAQLKSALDEQNAVLGRRAKELVDRAKLIEAGQQRSAEKESALASREAALRHREAQLTDLVKAAEERRQQYEGARQAYAARVEEQGRQSAETARKGADLEQRLKAFSEKDTALRAREERLGSAGADLDRRERELTAKEAAVRAAEAEVSLRRQAIGRSELASAGAAPAIVVDRRGAVASSARSAPAGAREASGVREVSGTAPAGEPEATLATPTTRRFPDRLPSGTARLDDLLLGGIPPRGHVVLVGDAFVGKEVLLYSFLAEGLKRGEPTVLVTAARSPAEVSQSLGVVLPQFREYEQMGMVQWIDASGSGGTPGRNQAVVKSSDDRAGILSNLVRAASVADRGKDGAFRVGFLGLSAVLAHSDERASFSFLQNVVGILKPRHALAMYSLEAGALSEPQVETLLSRMDGAVVFRQDRDRLLLSVRGFGDVETREWVECRVTPRGLVVGSFALERIR